MVNVYLWLQRKEAEPPQTIDFHAAGAPGTGTDTVPRTLGLSWASTLCTGPNTVLYHAYTIHFCL